MKAMRQRAIEMARSWLGTGGPIDVLLRPLQQSHVRDWHYVPRQRSGLPLRDMTEEQRQICWALVDLALSDKGRDQARAVTRLESILGEIENRPDFRDSDNYALSIFGDPRMDGPWAWRFEGHHLSMTFICDAEDNVLVTPMFFGANRQTVPASHPKSGLRILPDEEDRGFALVNMLDDAYLTRAVIGDRSPGDILTGPGRETSLRGGEGLALAAMHGAVRNAAEDLIATYLNRLEANLREIEEIRIRQAGLEKTVFAWSGSRVPGAPHYYRMVGPTFVIEYENSQNGANHCHSVWHNPLHQFGGDLLKAHFKQTH